jgi:hypothetical protein
MQRILKSVEPSYRDGFSCSLRPTQASTFLGSCCNLRCNGTHPVNGVTIRVDSVIRRCILVAERLKGLTLKSVPVCSTWGDGCTIPLSLPLMGDYFDMLTWLVDEVRGIFGIRRAEYGRRSDSYNVIGSAGVDPFRAPSDLDPGSVQEQARRLEASRRRLEVQTSRLGSVSH